MSVKLADTLAPMGNFAIGESKDIDIEINGTNKRLQQAYEDGDLGGGSSIQIDTMPIASAENENMIVEFVGESGTYQNGYFYQNIGSGDPKVYSWVQKNVQPTNATATDVSYDNTTSELVATNVQDAIDEIKGGLGTASGKNFTDLVRPNSHELVESGSVYSAINNALSSIYTPRGELTCAELTSSLLIEDNVGNIYTMSDSGTTSALFINGVGQTINVNDNVGIIKAGPNTYLFNLMGDAFDLHDYQKKELSTTIASATTVEGALSALNNGKVTKHNYTMDGTASLEDDIKTFVTALIALGANTYVGFFNRSGSLGTAGNYSITIYAEEGTSTFASGYIALGAGALGKTQYMVSYYKPTGSSEEWTIKKLATTDDILDNNHNGGFMAKTVVWFKTGNLFAYPNAGGFYSSTFLMSDRDGAWTGILKLADDGAGSVTATIVSLGGSPRGGEEFYYDETSYCLYFCGTWDRITITQLTGKKADLSITSTTQEEAKQNIKIVPINVVTEDNSVKILSSDTFTDMNAFLVDLKTRGTSFYKGKVYLSSTAMWHDYDICINIGVEGYWYGIGNLRSEAGAEYYVYKTYSLSDSWTIQKLVTKDDLPLVKYLYVDGASYASLNDLLAVVIASIGQIASNGSAGVFNGVWTGNSHFSVQWTCPVIASVSNWNGWFSLTLENLYDSHSIYSVSVVNSAISTQRAIV